ncbi:MAG: hypothetical protein IPM79_37360 [Polyangiaceae bacterium]|nr:hypothetical protein [Polyangiaceae bacterium]
MVVWATMRWLTVVVGVATLGVWATPVSAAEPCPAVPAAGSTPGSADELYAKARAAFEAKRFTEAAPIFAAVALEHSTHEVGPFAAMLSLESLNLSGAVCPGLMADLTHRYRALYCAAPVAAKHDETCRQLTRVGNDLQRLDAEALVKKADATHGEAARKLYLQAGAAYEGLWTKSLAEACKKGELAGCARAEEILYNAARAYQAGRDQDKALAMRAALIDPKHKLHQTFIARRAVYEQGGAYQALAEYAKAAEHYERFASESPKDEKAPTALLDAVVLRLGLGQLEQAQKAGELWEKSFGPKHREDHARLVLAISEALVARREWKGVKKYLEPRRAVVVAAQPPHQPVVDLSLAKALEGLGNRTDARKAFERAASPPPQVFNLDVDDPTQLRMFGRGLTAMGEARLWLARESRDVALKLTVKKGDAASLAEKRAAIATAEKELQKVLALQPVPPPGPSVAAAADVARMKGQLWAQAHLALGSDVAEQLFFEAKAANKACVSLGVKLEVAAPSCEAWLAKHFPKETPLGSPVAPRADRFGLPQTAPPRPLDAAEEEVVPKVP